MMQYYKANIQGMAVSRNTLNIAYIPFLYRRKLSHMHITKISSPVALTEV